MDRLASHVAFSPYKAATHCVDRAKALLAAAADPANAAITDDLRRVSVVMVVAALDTYMHRLIVDRAYRHDVLPGKLAGLSLTFRDALRQADAAGKAARAKPHKSRPRVALKRALRDRLLRDTFQRYDDVSTALGMAGLSGNWGPIGQALVPPLQPAQIEVRLNAIVDRRNQVAHEGDYVRLDRPQTARMNVITQQEAADDIAFISSLVDAIHSVI
jgi:hypothetical protein